MKHVVIACFVSLLSANLALADTKNQCKLDVILAPSPFGLGVPDNSEIVELQTPLAQGFVNVLDRIYNENGKESFPNIVARFMLDKTTVSEETVMHIVNGYLNCMDQP